MKYIVIFFILTIPLFSFCKNDSISALYEENCMLKEKISKLEKKSIKLSKDIERVVKGDDINFTNLNTRFSDYQWWFWIFLTILAGAFTVNWVSTREVAREQARKEIRNTKNEYISELNKIKDEALNILIAMTAMQIDAQQQINEYKQELEKLKKS